VLQSSLARQLIALVAAVLAVLACATPAHAGRTQESFFQDDRLLANYDFGEQTRALDTLRLLGVDTIHTVVNWRRFAPSPNRRTKPAGFDATSSASYGATKWDIYDSLVRGAQARGISVLMSPAGPIPNWASRCRKNVNFACKPDPKLYGEFVKALARRYSGTWVDEDQEQTALPRVGRWSVWNEPNLGAWLYPQGKRVRGRNVYIGAAYYRRLAYSARAALDATGHRGDQFLLGETAPIGGGSTRTPPAEFLRQLFCLSDKGKRLRGREAKQQGCTHAKRLRASGISHHPYARGAGVPTSRRQRPGSITIGTIGRLLPIIRAARHSRVAPRRLPVYITEFGVTTKPPDRKFGVALNRQAQYLNLVDYLAFQRPWIKSVSQFQLADDTGLADRGTFQTGLMFGSGAAKPSLAAYRIPIFVVRKRRRVTVFGQIRPVRVGTPRARIQIQNRRPGHGWATVTSRRTNRRGYVLVGLKARKGSWRIRWVEPDGTVSYSRGSDAVLPSTPTTPGLPPPGGGTPPPIPPPSGNPNTPPPTGTQPPPPVAQYTLTVTLGFTDLAPGVLDAGGTVTSSPAGIGCNRSNSPCQASYTYGTSVTLTATPDAGSAFDGWSGEGCSGTGQCTVPITQARSVTAHFSRTGP
jgi:hypothetical protein